ncbi:MAG: NAD(P)/FAD-dependent oxidoreductase, partial [Planctomycetota bacterium]
MADGGPQVAVIGGGAAGFFAAIVCAEANPQARVTIYEGGSEPLAKVRISGGGRCNVTHACFDPQALATHYPRGGRELRRAFARFQPRDTVAWFAAGGIALATEDDGRMFPRSNDSATIVDHLRHRAAAAGVTLRLRCPVRNVTASDGGGLTLTLADDTVTADRVLLATGGGRPGHALAASLGHSIEAPVPSL